MGKEPMPSSSNDFAPGLFLVCVGWGAVPLLGRPPGPTASFANLELRRGG